MLGYSNCGYCCVVFGSVIVKCCQERDRVFKIKYNFFWDGKYYKPKLLRYCKMALVLWWTILFLIESQSNAN